MARIPYPDRDSLTADTLAVLDKLPPRNIFAMLAGGEGLLAAFTRFGNHLLFKSSLDPVLRELAIIRVGVLSGAGYEVQQHEAIARQLGIGEELIAAAHDGPQHTALDDLQRLVLRFTDDLVANVRAGDDTFRPVHERLSLQQLQELTMTIGYYMAVCRFLETFDVDVETDDDAPWGGGRG